MMWIAIGGLAVLGVVGVVTGGGMAVLAMADPEGRGGGSSVATMGGLILVAGAAALLGSVAWGLVRAFA